MYQTFRRAFVYAPGDNEWTDCHRFNNGSHNPLDRLAFVRELFFPQIGRTTGGQIRPVASQAEGAEFSEFVENVMFIKQDVMFATLHVVGSNNGIAPWNSQPNPFDPGDTCATPRIDRIQEFNRRKAAALDWLEQIFDAADDTRALFLMIQVNPDNPPAAGCPNGFTDIMNALANHAAEYGKPVMLAHGDDHFFFIDQPLPNLLYSRVQTYGEFLVHWLKVHVDPRSSGVFSIEQRIVRSNLWTRSPTWWAAVVKGTEPNEIPVDGRHYCTGFPGARISHLRPQRPEHSTALRTRPAARSQWFDGFFLRDFDFSIGDGLLHLASHSGEAQMMA